MKTIPKKLIPLKDEEPKKVVSPPDFEVEDDDDTIVLNFNFTTNHMSTPSGLKNKYMEKYHARDRY